MVEFGGEEIEQLRTFLRERLLTDITTFHGHEEQRRNIHDVITRTAEYGESNSLLIIGPRECGKTTLMEAITTDLLNNYHFVNNTLVVRLNGNIDTDDRIALRTITRQLKLQNVVGDKVFGSFAENLAFLLASLKQGSKNTKSVLFIIDEFNLFCTHHNQTLLYNLLDISQSAQTPICVLGITCRLDVIELLEKRVKSRFSHRQIFLFSRLTFERYLELFVDYLSVPSPAELSEVSKRVELLLFHNRIIARRHFKPQKYNFSKKFIMRWNKHVADLLSNQSLKKSLQHSFNYNTSIANLKRTLLYPIVALSAEQPRISVEIIIRVCQMSDQKQDFILGLSVLELCLVIAMNHHSDIYDREPFNFEIIFNRFSKFAKASSSMQGIERAVAMKAFEHLRKLELILPVSNFHHGIKKEFEMHRMALTSGQICSVVDRYQALPTEVAQWAKSYLT